MKRALRSGNVAASIDAIAVAFLLMVLERIRAWRRLRGERQTPNGDTSLRRRVALYVRTAAGNEAGLEAQIEVLTAFAQARMWTVTKTYRDVGSSSMSNRPGLVAALADASRGAFDVLLAEEPDRLSRERSTLSVLEEGFRKFGVCVLALPEPVDTRTNEGRAIVAIMDSFTAADRAFIAERLKLAKESGR